jgi:hypothetical protein
MLDEACLYIIIELKPHFGTHTQKITRIEMFLLLTALQYGSCTTSSTHATLPPNFDTIVCGEAMRQIAMQAGKSAGCFQVAAQTCASCVIDSDCTYCPSVTYTVYLPGSAPIDCDATGWCGTGNFFQYVGPTIGNVDINGTSASVESYCNTLPNVAQCGLTGESLVIVVGSAVIFVVICSIILICTCVCRCRGKPKSEVNLPPYDRLVNQHVQTAAAFRQQGYGTGSVDPRPPAGAPPVGSPY